MSPSIIPDTENGTSNFVGKPRQAMHSSGTHRPSASPYAQAAPNVATRIALLKELQEQRRLAEDAGRRAAALKAALQQARSSTTPPREYPRSGPGRPPRATRAARRTTRSLAASAGGNDGGGPEDTSPPVVVSSGGRRRPRSKTALAPDSPDEDHVGGPTPPTSVSGTAEDAPQAGSDAQPSLLSQQVSELLAAKGQLVRRVRRRTTRSQGTLQAPGGGKTPPDGAPKEDAGLQGQSQKDGRARKQAQTPLKPEPEAEVSARACAVPAKPAQAELVSSAAAAFSEGSGDLGALAGVSGVSGATAVMGVPPSAGATAEAGKSDVAGPSVLGVGGPEVSP